MKMKPCAISIITPFLSLSLNLMVITDIDVKIVEGFLLPFPQPFRNVVPAPVSVPVLVPVPVQGQRKIQQHPSPSFFALYGGTGTTANYTWNEEQFEIELRIPVPAETKAKHVRYKPTSKSMELCLEMKEGEERKVLLHGDRIFRGLVDLDGTFWSLLDVEENENTSTDGTSTDSDSNNDSDSNSDSDSNNDSTGRELVLSIEKLITPPDDPFAVVDYDWGSVYLNDEDEILTKHYDIPEELDIKDYAASLGVDIDNINMTLVDKSMFSSGLNLTKKSLEDLTNSGYAQEVTSQGDGMEFLEEGVAFKSLGDGIGEDEMEDAGIGQRQRQRQRQHRGQSRGPPIPFLDTDSPWRKNMPVEEARGVDMDMDMDMKGSSSSSAIGQESGSNAADAAETSADGDSTSNSPPKKYQDPVDALTVSKLKDILRKEGLKVSGSKKELQVRLKDHVNSVMETKLQQKKNENDIDIGTTNTGTQD